MLICSCAHILLNARVAEEVIFGSENVTTGASNDFQQVSQVARQMVERFGFSKKIGQVALGGGGGNPFLGQQVKPQPQTLHVPPLLS
jgi:cell division protease FtsH